ncbi:hypothetical protein B0181_07965 [Moraxella caviae]|nr:hypothetical protein B0181_07965 [Moraxella caviae]
MDGLSYALIGMANHQQTYTVLKKGSAANRRALKQLADTVGRKMSKNTKASKNLAMVTDDNNFSPFYYTLMGVKLVSALLYYAAQSIDSGDLRYWKHFQKLLSSLGLFQSKRAPDLSLLSLVRISASTTNYLPEFSFSIHEVDDNETLVWRYEPSGTPLSVADTPKVARSAKASTIEKSPNKADKAKKGAQKHKASDQKPLDATPASPTVPNQTQQAADGKTNQNITDVLPMSKPQGKAMAIPAVFGRQNTKGE